MRQSSFGARRDGLHATNQPLRRRRSPVPGEQGPHHHLHIEFARFARKPRISQAKWRTKPFRGPTQRVFDRRISQAQLDSNLRRAQPKKIRARLSVIADDMTASGNLAHQLPALSAVTPAQTARRWDFAALTE